MARPIKQGLDYFPLDVNFFNDDKIQLIEAEFGIKGTYIAIRLLTKIYFEGYYYEWSADKCLLLTKNIGAESVSNVLVNEVVNGLIRRGIFSNSVFKQFNILTSTGIQKRFLNAISRRTIIPIIKEIWLIPIPKNINVNIYSINDDINSINVSNNTQSKGKESKGKKSKVTHTKKSEKIFENFDEVEVEEIPTLETEKEIPLQKSSGKKVSPIEDVFLNNLSKFQNDYPNTKRFQEICMFNNKPEEFMLKLFDEFIEDNRKSREHATKEDYTYFYQSIDKHFFYWAKAKISKPTARTKREQQSEIYKAINEGKSITEILGV